MKEASAPSRGEWRNHKAFGDDSCPVWNITWKINNCCVYFKLWQTAGKFRRNYILSRYLCRSGSLLLFLNAASATIGLTSTGATSCFNSTKLNFRYIFRLYRIKMPECSPIVFFLSFQLFLSQFDGRSGSAILWWRHQRDPVAANTDKVTWSRQASITTPDKSNHHCTVSLLKGCNTRYKSDTRVRV